MYSGVCGLYYSIATLPAMSKPYILPSPQRALYKEGNLYIAPRYVYIRGKQMTTDNRTDMVKAMRAKLNAMMAINMAKQGGI